MRALSLFSFLLSSVLDLTFILALSFMNFRLSSFNFFVYAEKVLLVGLTEKVDLLIFYSFFFSGEPDLPCMS